MRQPITFAASFVAAIVLASPAALARDVYVSATTGSNDNEGTKESPKKLLWKVLSDLQPGDHIRVAEGVYNGQKKVGVMPKLSTGNVTIEGGWKADFSERDPFSYLSIITGAPDRQGESGEVFHYEGKEGNITIDGFCIDRATGNYYTADGESGANKRIEGHKDTSCWGYRDLNKKKSGSDPAIELLGGGKIVVRNNIMINNPWWGIYVKSFGNEQVVIENNLVLSYQGRGIEAIGTGGAGKENLEFIIRNNTVAFGCDIEGRALSIDPRPGYGKFIVENNVLAFGDQSGFMTKFEAKGDALTLKNNLFYFFAKGDAGNGGSALCNAGDFEDELECKASGNVHECPKFVAKISQAWFDRWSQRKAIADGRLATPDELVEARKVAGLGEWKLFGWDETFADYKKLPGGRTVYTMSRYPRPFKEGEDLMDWSESILPILGADGARGVQPFSGE